MYQLFCDSNCELWHTTVKELGLNVIRMPYTIGDKEYFYDMGEHTDFKAFFDQMRAGAVPKTSALNEYAYTEYFEPVLARGEDIYYVTFSHKMSATFNAMDAAIKALKEKYPDREIRYKDSKTISLGSGFVTYYAALKYNEGATMDELDAYLDELIPHTATYFVVDDLTYLHRGGRISGVSKVVGNLLGIKPILRFDEEGGLPSGCACENGVFPLPSLHLAFLFLFREGAARPLCMQTPTVWHDGVFFCVVTQQDMREAGERSGPERRR